MEVRKRDFEKNSLKNTALDHLFRSYFKLTFVYLIKIVYFSTSFSLKEFF